MFCFATIVFNTRVKCIPRATGSAVSCLLVPAFICIDLLISRVLKINDDDFQVVHIYALHIGPSFSRPAISCLAKPRKLVRQFHVLQFQSTPMDCGKLVDLLLRKSP